MLPDAASPEPRRKLTRPDASPPTPSDPRKAFTGRRTKAVPILDDLARAYPGRRISMDRERKGLLFYSRDNEPNAFSMDSLEFLFIIAQFYRGSVPLRLILVLIANQQAGGEIRLTQDQMADVLDIHRSAVSDALAELAEHGIVMKLGRGRYQLNPCFAYRGAQLTRLPDGRTEFVQVEQADVLDELRKRSDLPDKVRYPSLDALTEAIEATRAERAERRKKRAADRAAATRTSRTVQAEMLFGDDAIAPTRSEA